MTFEIFFVLILVVVAVVLFATEKLRVDLVALIVMAVLLLSGIITPEDGISGFSNTATVTVGAMFVLSAGLYKTGSVNFIGFALAKIGKRNFWFALITMMIGIGAISAFINNTAAVAIFLPIALAVARDTKVSPSKLLMPLSFASMFGGVCTLIGTSTNILVNSIAVRRGEPAFSMFEFAPLGLVMFAAGLIYMVVLGVRLIPERRTAEDLTQSFGVGDYLTEILIQPESSSVGKPLRGSPLVQDLDIDVIDIYREGAPLRPISPWTILHANDMLRVRANVEKIKKLKEVKGIVLKSDKKFQDQDLKTSESTLVEAVIGPNSILEDRTLKKIRFRNIFGARALAIRHRGEVMHDHLETTILQAGDVLLLEVREENLDSLRDHPAFVIVNVLDLPKFRYRKILPAVAIVTAVITSAALGIVPIVVGAIAGSVLMILAGCLNLEEAYEAIDWKVLFLLAGVLTLGVALENTGAADIISGGLIKTVGAFGPFALIAAFYLLTSLLTETMSNNATAALLAPIAMVTADSLGLNPRPFLMAVTFAASASFMTPVGYQTNTLIYGPGQYKFFDFFRVGAPLNLLFWILAVFLIPYFWPL